MITQPVDKFFFKLLNEKEEYKDLWNVFRMMLVISHGQAHIERGFSVNKDIANDNMKEESFVAHRRVYHGVTSSGYELHELPVTKEMLTLCKQSRQKYHEYRENQKKLKQLTKQEEEKKQLTSQLKEEQRTKEITEAEEKNLIRRADELCEKAERQHQWNLVVEANALRARGKEKRKALEEISSKIEEIQKKIKKE